MGQLSEDLTVDSRRIRRWGGDGSGGGVGMDPTVGWGRLEVVVDVDTYLEGVAELTEGEGCARR